MSAIPPPVPLRLAEVPEDLICSICMSVPTDPTITPCQHVFCGQCIYRALNVSNFCPIDREPCQIHQLQSLAGCTRRIWSGLQVKCGNHESGCAWTGGIGDYEGHARTTCTHANVAERSARRIDELEAENARLVDQLQASESSRISMDMQLRVAEAKILQLETYKVRCNLQENESKRLFDGRYDYDRHDVVRLAQLISKHLEDKPSEIDRNKIYDCIRCCYNALDRGYSDNPEFYYMDMRMLLATCLASTWFSDRQKDSLRRWYSEHF